MVKSTVILACLLGLACASGAEAGLFGWLSAPKDNETEYDLMGAVEQVGFRRTSARMTGDAATLRMLEEREAVLTLRLRIARARAVRDQARAAGDKKRAERMEREVDVAKRELVALVARVETRMASASASSGRSLSQARAR